MTSSSSSSSLPPHTSTTAAKAPTSPDSQDSPYFRFVSNLSPLSSAKAVHAAQHLSDINCPPLFPMPNLQQAESSWRRKDFSCSCSSDFSFAHNNSGTPFNAASNFPGPPGTQLIDGMIHSGYLKNDSDNSVQMQPQRLLRHANMDGSSYFEGFTDFPQSGDFYSKEAKHMPQVLHDSCLHLKRPAAAGTVQGLSPEVAAQPASIDGIVDGTQAKPLPSKVAANEGEQDGCRPSNVWPVACSQQFINNLQSDMSFRHVSDGRQSRSFAAQFATDSLISMSNKKIHADTDVRSDWSKTPHYQDPGDVNNAEHRNQCGLYFYPQAALQPLPILGSGKHDWAAQTIPNEYVQNKMPFAIEEVSHHQRNMPRRCLSFDAAEIRYNASGAIPSSRLLVKPTCFECLESSYLKSTATLSNRLRPNNFSESTMFMPSLCPASRSVINVNRSNMSFRDIGNTPMQIPMPSSMGLHLNSIINVAEFGSAASMENNCPIVIDKKLPCMVKQHLLKDSKNCPVSTSLSGNISVDTLDAQKDSQAKEIGRLVSHSTNSTKCLNDTPQLKLIEQHMTPHHKSILPEKVDRFEQLICHGPKKKRTRALGTTDKLGCKHCNCKKSKCLKLYCECFSAGLYCAESCACHDCSNKLDYEDTVLETRKQVESRNPLAFAPKIVRRATESPEDIGEYLNQVTPFLVRHKMGCNCKKSQCQKRYCECYQAGIGCSEGCRCEGCKNCFGAKEGYTKATEITYKSLDNERKDIPDEKRVIVENRIDFLCSDQCHQQNISPMTPSLQSSDHEKDVPESCLPNINILSSSENSLRSVNNMNSKCSSETVGGESLVMCPFRLDSKSTIARKVDHVPSKENGLAEIHDTDPVHHLRRVSDPLSSLDTQAHVPTSSLDSKCQNGSSIARHPWLCEGSWKSESDGRLYDSLDDDTPEMPRECPWTIAVKSISPNQKRISSPRVCLYEHRETSPLGLRSGRKLVFQSVSTSPPLIPSSDPNFDTDNT